MSVAALVSVRFLLDQNVSPRLVGLLADAGHSGAHVRGLGMGRAPDDEMFAAARVADAVLVSSDTDFGELLARSNAGEPSVTLLRRQTPRWSLPTSMRLLTMLMRSPFATRHSGHAHFGTRRPDLPGLMASQPVCCKRNSRRTSG